MTAGIYVLVEHLNGAVEDITYIMLAASRTLARQNGEEVTALILGHEVQSLAKDLKANKVAVFDHPSLKDFSSDTYLQVLTHFFTEHPPAAVIAGHTSVGMDLVCGLASRLGFPLVSQCMQFTYENEETRFISQIYGGKIEAEGKIPQPGVVISFVPGSYKVEQGKADIAPEVKVIEMPAISDPKVKLVGFVEPDLSDVDISKAEVLVAVGRGMQNGDDMELAEELAAALGGAVCGSRPIVDQGWLPTTRLVGKSGLTVKPKIYLAFGISGAPEHAQAITESDLIIAVNTDPMAPIFNIAQFGIEADMMDLMPALTETIHSIKER